MRMSRPGRSASSEACGVPRHLPAHEVVVANALVVRTLTEDREVISRECRCESSVTWVVNHVQPSHCSAGPAGAPHEVVRRLAVGGPRTLRGGWIGPWGRSAGWLGRPPPWQPPTGRRNRVALMSVRLLLNPQRIQFGLKGGPVDHHGTPGVPARSRSAPSDVVRCLLHDCHMLLCQEWRSATNRKWRECQRARHPRR